MANTRKCLTCGKVYNYCPTCGKAADTPWKKSYDTESCKSLFNVISGYNMGIKTKKDIKRVLDKYNITDYSRYVPNISSVLEELFSVKNNSFKKNKKKYLIMDVEFNQEDKVEEENKDSEEVIEVQPIEDLGATE